MRVLIYGKGGSGRIAYGYAAGAGIEVAGVFDESVSSGDGSRLILADHAYAPDPVPVVSMPDAACMYASGEADAVILATDNELADFVVRGLTDKGIDRIAYLPAYYADGYDVSDDSFMWIETDKPRMPYLEYHISFHCNLKCAGCTHFSNIVTAPRYGDIEHFRDDLLRLQELFWGIGKIRLMGGEPLLNPDLAEYVYIARAAFPDADIRVVSNGLLLREDHAPLLDAMRDTAVYFDVSMYPPTVAAIERISQICTAHGVKLTVTPPITQFTAGMNLHGNADPAGAYAQCPASHCAYLCDGHISTCAMPQLADIYNERYGTDISAGSKDVADIYENGLDGYTLLKRLKSPMDICRYCDEHRRTYDWYVSADPDRSEWIGAMD